MTASVLTWAFCLQHLHLNYFLIVERIVDIPVPAEQLHRITALVLNGDLVRERVVQPRILDAIALVIRGYGYFNAFCNLLNHSQSMQIMRLQRYE